MKTASFYSTLRNPLLTIYSYALGSKHPIPFDEEKTGKIARGFSLLFDSENAWRKTFLLFRITDRFKSAPLVRHLRKSCEKAVGEKLLTSPRLIGPYLRHVHATEGQKKASMLAESIESTPDVSAAQMAEVANYYFSVGLVGEGDDAINMAKKLDSNHTRIFEIEAWNQRHRGNLHHELQAVEICLQRATQDAEHLKWSFWLGEILLRQQKPQEAWAYLHKFHQLPQGDIRALSSAYCAQQLGFQDTVVLAYLHATTSRTLGVLEVAKGQLAYERDEEVIRLLTTDQIGETVPGLELLYLSSLRRGNIEEAYRFLKKATEQPDASQWVYESYAMFADLVKQSEEVVNAYNRIPQPVKSSFHLFRQTIHMVNQSGDEVAVRFFLRYHARQQISSLSRDPAVDLDPMLPSLLQHISQEDRVTERIKLLSEAAIRASSMALTRAVNLELAFELAAEARFEEALSAIHRTQNDKLPVLNLSTKLNRRVKDSRETRYAEICDTEAVQQNVVLYESFHGAKIACNPLAICLELLSNPKFQHLTHVWSVQEGAPIHERLLQHENVAFVRKDSTGFIRHLATAKYLVNNSTFETYFSRRPEQRYLNTWHGIPWKKLGKDNIQEPLAYGNIARNIRQTTMLVSPDAHTQHVMTDGMDCQNFPASSVHVGSYPRLQLTNEISTQRRTELLSTLGMTDSQKLVLFMPTWQGEINDRSPEVDDVLQTAHALSAHGYQLAVRAHHFVAQAFNRIDGNFPFIMVPESMDTNELLGISHAVVTDFSSVLFDAASTRIPLIKLLKDFEKYKNERGVYFEPHEVPGQDAYSVEEALSLIADALQHPTEFIEKYEPQTMEFGGYFDPESVKELCETFVTAADHPSARTEIEGIADTLLISASGLRPNGITRALRSLLVNLSQVQPLPFLLTSESSMKFATQETRDDLRQYARFILVTGRSVGTRMEQEVLRFFNTPSFTLSSLTEHYLRGGRAREGRRLFGAECFAGVVDYSVYDSARNALAAYGTTTTGNRGVILHNEMEKEKNERFPKLKSGLMILNSYDFLGSVSEGVRQENASALAQHYGIDPERHILTENTVNVQEILELSQAPLSTFDAEWYEKPGVHGCVVARLSPEKNHLDFLRALAKARDRLEQPLYLSVLGDGPMLTKLQEFSETHGISDIVRFLGQVPNPYPHITSSDVLFLPSKHEGQPLVILEALTVGTPVIASDIPGSRSALQYGKYGTIVPLTLEGLEEGILQASRRDFVGPDAFDAEILTRNSVKMFVDALSESKTSSIV